MQSTGSAQPPQLLREGLAALHARPLACWCAPCAGSPPAEAEGAGRSGARRLARGCARIECPSPPAGERSARAARAGSPALNPARPPLASYKCLPAFSHRSRALPGRPRALKRALVLMTGVTALRGAARSAPPRAKAAVKSLRVISSSPARMAPLQRAQNQGSSGKTEGDWLQAFLVRGEGGGVSQLAAGRGRRQAGPPRGTARRGRWPWCAFAIFARAHVRSSSVLSLQVALPRRCTASVRAARSRGPHMAPAARPRLRGAGRQVAAPAAHSVQHARSAAGCTHQQAAAPADPPPIHTSRTSSPPRSSRSLLARAPPRR